MFENQNLEVGKPLKILESYGFKALQFPAGQADEIIRKAHENSFYRTLPIEMFLRIEGSYRLISAEIYKHTSAVNQAKIPIENQNINPNLHIEAPEEQWES